MNSFLNVLKGNNQKNNEQEMKDFVQLMKEEVVEQKYHNLKEGIFAVNGLSKYCCCRKKKRHYKLAVYDHRSLWCFNWKNKFRIFMVDLTESQWFERFIIVIIILNSISLAMYD